MKLNTNWSVLAGLRFTLASIVFFSHMGGYHHFRPCEFADFLGSLGAVMAFFMISGYSIAHSITNRPERFILRRIWRIWPTYLFTFFVLTLPVTFFFVTYTGWQIVGNALLLQGLFIPVLESNSSTWSLAIEELLYYCSPLFQRTHTFVLAGLIAISSLFYFYSDQLGWTRFAGEVAGRGVICCAWAWLLGFVYYRHADNTLAKISLIFIPVMLMGACNQLPGKLQCSVVLGTALLLIYSPSITTLSEKMNRRLNWLGNISYPLYICHAPIWFVLSTIHFLKNSATAFIVVVFGMSIFIYHYIDAPNRGRWKRANRLQRAQTDQQAYPAFEKT